MMPIISRLKLFGSFLPLAVCRLKRTSSRRVSFACGNYDETGENTGSSHCGQEPLRTAGRPCRAAPGCITGSAALAGRAALAARGQGKPPSRGPGARSFSDSV